MQISPVCISCSLKPTTMGFMRMGSFRALPGKAEELLRIYQQEAIPVIRTAPGNTAAFILQQHSTDNFLACTAWHTKTDAENYDKTGKALEMVNKIRHCFDGPPVLTTYDTHGI